MGRVEAGRTPGVLCGCVFGDGGQGVRYSQELQSLHGAHPAQLGRPGPAGHPAGDTEKGVSMAHIRVSTGGHSLHRALGWLGRLQVPHSRKDLAEREPRKPVSPETPPNSGLQTKSPHFLFMFPLFPAQLLWASSDSLPFQTPRTAPGHCGPVPFTTDPSLCPPQSSWRPHPCRSGGSGSPFPQARPPPRRWRLHAGKSGGLGTSCPESSSPSSSGKKASHGLFLL